MIWREEFTCFDNEIDKQHKMLFEIANRLLDIINLDNSYDHFDEILDVFKELSDYTAYHFNYEEKLMADLKYDAINIKMQQIEHGKFIKKVAEIDDNKLDDDQKGITSDMVLFVLNWIEDHILYTDKKFGLFLKELKVEK